MTALKTLLQGLDFSTGAGLTLAEENTLEAVKGYCAAVTTVTRLGPEILAGAAAEIAGTAIMEDAATTIGDVAFSTGRYTGAVPLGTQSASLTSFVIANVAFGAPAKTTYTDLFNRLG